MLVFGLVEGHWDTRRKWKQCGFFSGSKMAKISHCKCWCWWLRRCQLNILKGEVFWKKLDERSPGRYQLPPPHRSASRLQLTAALIQDKSEIQCLTNLTQINDIGIHILVLGGVDRNAAKLLKFTPKRFHVKDRFSIGRPPNLLRVISVNVMCVICVICVNILRRWHLPPFSLGSNERCWGGSCLHISKYMQNVFKCFKCKMYFQLHAKILLLLRNVKDF